MISLVIFNIFLTILGSAKEPDIQCQSIGNSCYEISWGALEGAGNYHLFAADQWQDLIPLSSPKAFIESPESSATLVSITDKACLHLDQPFRYLRVIQEEGDSVKDVARLITFQALTKETISEEFIIAKERESQYSSEITPEIWNEVTPYLIADEHPIKITLDKLFSESRIIDSVESLKKAGFVILFQQLNRGLIVVKHRTLPNYLVKLYLDSSPRSEWPLWVLRAKGARFIQKLIDQYTYSHCMKVPEKWIYPIPKERRPVGKDSKFSKDFVLIVRDMRLTTPNVNLSRFKEGMTYARLRALYTLITEGGLSDSHIGNVPFSRDGKMAFIDTEYVNSWPVHLDWLTEYFSPVNQQYWNWLIRDGKKY